MTPPVLRSFFILKEKKKKEKKKKREPQEVRALNLDGFTPAKMLLERRHLLGISHGGNTKNPPMDMGRAGAVVFGLLQAHG